MAAGCSCLDRTTQLMTSDNERLTDAWNRVQEELPPGWRLDGLRCASAGLAPDQRSDDWVAVAVSPDGDERSFRAADPVAALEGLARAVRRD